MNTSHAKKSIQEKEAKIDKFNREIRVMQRSIANYKDTIARMEDEVNSHKGNIVLQEVLIDDIKKQLYLETDCKRKVTAILKKNPSLHLDDDSDEDRGTYLWLYCDLFTEDNEEDDPYYDEHYMDDWAECYERCTKYIELIVRKEIKEEVA